MEKHWEPARVEGTRNESTVTLKTENVTLLWVEHQNPQRALTMELDGQTFAFQAEKEGVHKVYHNFSHVDGKWMHGEKLGQTLLKKPGLQGPIDDAFMDSFVNVKPTGRPMNSKTAEWAEKEMKHAVDHWRKQFRGDAPVKNDNEITRRGHREQQPRPLGRPDEQ